MGGVRKNLFQSHVRATGTVIKGRKSTLFFATFCLKKRDPQSFLLCLIVSKHFLHQNLTTFLGHLGAI